MDTLRERVAYEIGQWTGDADIGKGGNKPWAQWKLEFADAILAIFAEERGALLKEVDRVTYHHNAWKDRAEKAEAREAKLVEALVEITKGAGAFDRDPLKHAENCIEDMKTIARAALASVKDVAK